MISDWLWVPPFTQDRCSCGRYTCPQELSDLQNVNKFILGSLVLSLSSFSCPRAEGMGSWWAPSLVVRTHLTGVESWRVAPIGPPDHAALIGCCPRFSRSPKPLHSHVHCPRGSHHHSGEWHGGGAACACKFPQAVFSSQWVMDLFSLFKALEQQLTRCPEPVGNILIPVLPWLQYCPPAAPLLPYLEINLILLF